MRFLVAGMGGIGQRHVRNLRALVGPSAEILAYRVRRDSPTLTDNLHVEAGGNVEEKYGLTVFGDLEAALGQMPDAVLVCNPSGLHMAVAMKAAQAGCALFVEKPLTTNAQDAAELVDIVERDSLLGLVGYQMRFHPYLARLRTLLEARAIGQVVAVRVQVGEFLPGWHTYEDYRQMYASRADLGGGVILSQIHELDYVYWLFGMPTRVFALGGHLSRLEIDVEDTASILLECTVDGRSVPVHVQQDYIQRPPSRTCEVIGDAGKIVVDLREQALTVFDAEGNVAEATSNPGFERNRLFLDEMSHFLACLNGDETPRVSIRDGANSLLIALAAKQSIETGQVVEPQQLAS